MVLSIVNGWTGDLDFQLKSNNVAVDLSGVTITVVIYDNNGVTITPGGTVTIFDAVNGKVRYIPVVADFNLVGSPYSLRFKAVSAGKVNFFPSGPALQTIVRR